MEVLRKILNTVFAVIIAVMFTAIVGGIYAQASPPALPAPPRAVPWENIILVALGYLGYGVFRIIRKR